MADTFELVALALPVDIAPEALPASVKRLVADCWPGMSRAQLVARARRHALHPSLHAHGASAPGEMGRFTLSLSADGHVVQMVAHLRRVASRRMSARSAKGKSASRPPARDPRQTSLF